MDQGAIEVQPLLKNPLSKSLPKLPDDAGVGKVVRQNDRDSSKVPMFWCDGPECKGDPLDAHRSGLKNHIFESCCF